MAEELSEQLRNTYDPIKRREFENNIFKKWRETGEMPGDNKLWNIHNLTDSDDSIYHDVAASFLEDCDKNLGSYLQNTKNILIDTWHCTDMENEYFHYVASKHQEKNEKNSQKLIQRITDIQKQLLGDSNADSNAMVKNHPLTKQLINERRQKEEDAKCNICGSGDYEENDLIVFCGFCGIAVHQNCYGMEEVPTGDWFCITCFMFGKFKGRNLKCALCPKRGGAMKPTNIHRNDEFFSKVKSELSKGTEVNLDKLKPTPHYKIFKTEKKNSNLKTVLNYEHSFVADCKEKNPCAVADDPDLNNTFYDKMDENYNYKYEKQHEIETKYAWAHLSCANFIHEIDYTPKSPLRLGKLNPERFIKPCIICCQTDGAAIKCSNDDCDIWMHGECSRRAGYYLETAKEPINPDQENIKTGPNFEDFKIFCERHRPFKLIKEIQERHDSACKEMKTFCKSVRKALDAIDKIPYKCKSVSENKRWREKDKRILLDRVRERFFLLRKLRINIVKVDPTKKRKRKAKNKQKIPKRRKIGENAESKATNDGISVDGYSLASLNCASKNIKQKDVMYKLATPCFPPEPDWSVTLSRNDFPWYDVKFDDFTAKDCFEVYRTLIPDEETFNRKIRKERNVIVNKLMKENRKQIKKAKQQGFNAQPLSKKQLKKKAEQIKEYRKAQIEESNRMVHLQHKMTKEEVVAYNAKIAEENSMYCYCRGSQGKDPDDFYVACDGENCANNGWYHWKCVEELKYISKEQVENAKEWFCPSCKEKKKVSEEPKKNEGKFLLVIIMLTYLFMMNYLWYPRFTTSALGSH